MLAKKFKRVCSGGSATGLCQRGYNRIECLWRWGKGGVSNLRMVIQILEEY